MAEESSQTYSGKSVCTHCHGSGFCEVGKGCDVCRASFEAAVGKEHGKTLFPCSYCGGTGVVEDESAAGLVHVSQVEDITPIAGYPTRDWNIKNKLVSIATFIGGLVIFNYPKYSAFVDCSRTFSGRMFLAYVLVGLVLFIHWFEDQWLDMVRLSTPGCSEKSFSRMAFTGNVIRFFIHSLFFLSLRFMGRVSVMWIIAIINIFMIAVTSFGLSVDPSFTIFYGLKKYSINKGVILKNFLRLAGLLAFAYSYDRCYNPQSWEGYASFCQILIPVSLFVLAKLNQLSFRMMKVFFET